jgi:sugar lactone lactonase YvrE
VNAFRARPVSADHHELAEGPVWDPARGRVWWVDIEAATVFEGVLQDGEVQPLARRGFGGTVGAVVPATDGARSLVAGHRQVLLTDADGTVLDAIRVVPDGVASRLNDGGCDPAGRFLIGTMALDDREGEERLCRLEPDGGLAILDGDLTVSNGLAWAPDGTRLYSVDSGPGTVWVRPYDPGTGAVGARERLLRIEEGTPDGMCVDDDGNLWIAIFGRGEVRAYTPDGHRFATVEVPGAPDTTSVAFVGPELGTLLITTARHERSAAERERLPDAGRLFAAEVGARGLRVSLWDGRWPGRG